MVLPDISGDYLLWENTELNRKRYGDYMFYSSTPKFYFPSSQGLQLSKGLPLQNSRNNNGKKNC